MAKRGKPSEKEKMEIFSLLESGKSHEDIAKIVDRTVEWIYQLSLVCPSNTQNFTDESVIARLHRDPIWLELEKQFTSEELKMFDDRWIKLTAQFTDRLETDNMMLRDLIIIEIMMARCGKDMMSAKIEIDRLQIRIDDEMEKDKDDRNDDFITRWTEEKGNLQGSHKDRTKQYNDYMDRKNAKFKDLKSTREQRFKSVEDAKTSLFDWIKEIDIHEEREKQGRQLELMRLAADNARKELSKVILYENSKYDQPLLTPESILEGVLEDEKYEELL